MEDFDFAKFFKITLSVALLAGAGFVVFKWMHRNDDDKPVEHMWFYDLNTKKRFIALATEVPPIKTESGETADGESAGVRARVYGCGGCDESKQFVAFLEKYTPEAIEAMSDDNPDHIKAMQGLVVAHPDRLEWVNPNGGEARQIKVDAAARCPDGVRAKPCYP
jgi:hypothetical protein